MEFPECPQGCSCLQGVQLSQLHKPSGRCILIGAIYSVGAVETTAPPNCTPLVRKLNHAFKFSACKVIKYVNKL